MVDVCAGDLTGTWKVLGGCTDVLYWDGLLTCPPNTPEQLLGLGYAGDRDVQFRHSLRGEHRRDRHRPEVHHSQRLPARRRHHAAQEVSPICSGGSTCTCLAAGAGARAITGSGTYSIGGSELTFYPAPSSSIGGVSYCVEEELLHLETDVTITSGDGTRVSLDHERHHRAEAVAAARGVARHGRRGGYFRAARTIRQVPSSAHPVVVVLAATGGNIVARRCAGIGVGVGRGLDLRAASMRSARRPPLRGLAAAAHQALSWPPVRGHSPLPASSASAPQVTGRAG